MIKNVLLGICIAWVTVNFLFSSVSQAQDASTLQFQTRTVAQGYPDGATKCFIKGNKIRIEMIMAGENSIFLSNGVEAYMYMPKPNYAVSILMSDINDQISVFRDYHNLPGLKALREETVDGKVCDVYEYTQNNLPFILWVDKSTNSPFKSEGDTDKGRMAVYFTDFIKDSPIDDKLFELPAGVQIIKSPEAAQVLPEEKAK